MQVLFQGIWNKFNGNAALKAAVTNMYFNKAIQTAIMPYIVYHKISGRPDYTFTEDMENTLIQFNIYDSNSSSVTVNDIFEKLKTCYDWCSLTVTGWDSIYMKREFDDLTQENDVWRYLVQYRLEIQQ